MRSPKNLKVGSRGSALALAQARLVSVQLENALLVPIQTSGDRYRGKSLAEAGGKGLFVKEIEEALLRGDIDLAVHSLKDLPGVLPEALTLACFLKREDPRDCFLSLKYRSLTDLPEGAVVGTGSPRRKFQLLARRPDLKIEPVRGNVETRLQKLRDGKQDVLILAAAGLKRLGLEKVITETLDPAVLLPAAGQGIVAIEIRKSDAALEKFLREKFCDPGTDLAARAERAFLQTIGGDCYTPLAAFARAKGDQLHLDGWLASPDGRKAVRLSRSSPADWPEALGQTLAKEILDALAHYPS